MANTIVIVVASLIMLMGLLLTVMSLPGMTVIWLVALVYGLIEGFEQLGAWILGIMAVFMVGSYILSFWLRQAGARHTGASWKGIALGCVFGLFGVFLIPVIGLPLGVVAGVYAVEYARLRDAQEAWQTTRGAIFGFGIGILQESIVSFLMIGLWFFWVIRG